MPTREIEVALSYASEQDSYVRAVALDLQQHGIKVFFAPFEDVALWGEDLIPYLERVYRDWAKLCVMFISKEYIAKAWPAHERRSALSRQLVEQSAYILPVRFDDSPVPGLATTISYLRAADHKPTELAGMVRRKLALVGSSTPA